MLRRVALITGAAQGIGKAIALRLAKEGFDIAINDIRAKSGQLGSVAETIMGLGRRVDVVPADVSVEKDVQGMIGETVEKLGSLDVFHLTASVHDWDKTFEINVRGVFLCYKYAAKQMIEQGRGGRIIGASSAGGKQGFPGVAAYSASKFAVRGLTQSAALELGKYNITVNTYAPGAINTDMFLSSCPDIDVELATQRIGQPADIASVVAYLASDEAHFITGQSVSVDGGLVLS
ncbi:hypothetical protein VNI00_012271 [Paramarasmius palmivorus]|uniref:NAD(P)-binding protein n=1 Tax=Paramarasmius palmivorus TaxID=297713 RepID=A0AAW0CA47_9AGAR